MCDVTVVLSECPKKKTPLCHDQLPVLLYVLMRTVCTVAWAALLLLLLRTRDGENVEVKPGQHHNVRDDGTECLNIYPGVNISVGKTLFYIVNIFALISTDCEQKKTQSPSDEKQQQTQFFYDVKS